MMIRPGGGPPLEAGCFARDQVGYRGIGESYCYCDSLLFGAPFKAVRASGFLGDQSSGGKATRQNVGRGVENSRPISARPLRTGPRNATWHSCSSSVLLCLI